MASRVDAVVIPRTPSHRQESANSSIQDLIQEIYFSCGPHSRMAHVENLGKRAQVLLEDDYGSLHLKEKLRQAIEAARPCQAKATFNPKKESV